MLKKFDSPYIPPTFCSFPRRFSLLPTKGQIPLAQGDPPTSGCTEIEFQLVEAYVCQSFQTLYEASPIINVTQRSFAVFHPIMYVTQRSFAAPAPATRDFFWLYHTYSLLRRGFYNASSGFGLWAKTLRGQ